jgi:hypothetical protein
MSTTLFFYSILPFVLPIVSPTVGIMYQLATFHDTYFRDTVLATSRFVYYLYPSKFKL